MAERLVLGRKKLGGILVEARADGKRRRLRRGGDRPERPRDAGDLDPEGLPEATSLADAGVAPPSLDWETVLVAVLELLDKGLSAPLFDLPAAFDAVSAHRPGERLTVAEAGRETTGVYLGVTGGRLPPPRDPGRRGDGRVGRDRLVLGPIGRGTGEPPDETATPPGSRRSSSPSGARRSSCRRRTGG